MTSTDYFPGHSELLRVTKHADGSNQVSVERVNPSEGNTAKSLEYDHNFTRYNINEKVGVGTAFTDAVATADGANKAGPIPFLDKAENRATVALLTRSIRIMSEGDKPGDTLADATDGRKEDNTTSGPPSRQMPITCTAARSCSARDSKSCRSRAWNSSSSAKGGFLGRYPVHFHMARKVPDRHLRDRLIGERVDDPLVRHPLHLRRHAGPQRRLQVDRPWLFPGRRRPRPTTSCTPTSASTRAPRLSSADNPTEYLWAAGCRTTTNTTTCR